MNLFTIVSNVPFFHEGPQGVTAAHIVSFELIKTLQQLRQSVILQVILNPYTKDDSISPEDEKQLKLLRELGVTVLDPIVASEYMPQEPMSVFAKVLRLSKRRLEMDCI